MGEKIKIPKAIEDGFAAPEMQAERDVLAQIDEWRAAEETRLQQELFKQRQRLAAAERTLATKVTKKAQDAQRIASKVTKKAQDAQRIASSKTDQIAGWLADLQRTESKPRDSCIYPNLFTHVIVSENGKRVLRPMPYGCRPAGKPAFYDTKFPGTYNARRDNLEGFWKGQFGRHHAIMVAPALYEHVNRDGKDIVLEFKPSMIEPMLVACLWSHWSEPGEQELLSF